MSINKVADTQDGIAKLILLSRDAKGDYARHVCGWAAKEIARLRAIVDKLPKCWRLVGGELVQDVPMLAGMEVYHWADRKIWGGTVAFITENTARVETSYPGHLPWTECYDTHEAAEKARESAKEQNRDKELSC